MTLTLYHLNHIFKEYTNIILQIYGLFIYCSNYVDLLLQQCITLVDKLGAHLANILYVIEFLSYSLQGHDYF